MNSFILKLGILSIIVLFSQFAFSQNIPYYEAGKWGFATTDGNIVIPCNYEEVDFYSTDNLAMVKKGNKYGYINDKGKIVIPIEYDKCNRTYEVRHGSHSISIIRNPEIHLNYSLYPSDINYNRYIVSKNNRYGVLHYTEDKIEILVPLEYLKIQYDPVKKIFHCKNKTGDKYYDTNGQLANNATERNSFFEEDLMLDMSSSNKKTIIAKIGNKVGVIEQARTSKGISNDTIVSIKYDDIIMEKYNPDDFTYNEIFGVKSGNKWGIIGRKDKVILPIRYDSIDYDLSMVYKSKGIYVVKNNAKWGILSKKDENLEEISILLPFKYTSISKLYYAYLLVQIESKCQVFSINTEKLLSDKAYPSLTKYQYESVDGFYIFQTVNSKGQTVYVGENGVEFFKD
jgi:hypothetical protein